MFLKPHTPLKYPIGKDTVKAFGDGTVQIYSSGDGTYDLVDNENYRFNIRFVKTYGQVGKIAYIVGSDKYLVLNIETNKCTVFKTLDEMPADTKSIFSKIKDDNMPWWNW